MKKLLCTMIASIGVIVLFAGQPYTTIVRSHRIPSGSWNKPTELNINVYIEEGKYVKIGNQTFRFISSCRESFAPSGDIAKVYLAKNEEGKTLDIQVNISPETKKAVAVYVIYSDVEYGYIIK